MTTIAIIVVALIVGCCAAVMRRYAAENSSEVGLTSGKALRRPAQVRKSAKTAQKPAKKALAPRNPWRASSITSGDNACAAAQAIAGKRFLDSEKSIPVLPLPDCDAASCQCKYARHEDRRDASEDRRSPSALHSALYDQTGKVNRRQRKRGRRKTDWA